VVGEAIKQGGGQHPQASWPQAVCGDAKVLTNAMVRHPLGHPTRRHQRRGAAGVASLLPRLPCHSQKGGRVRRRPGSPGAPSPHHRYHRCPHLRGPPPGSNSH